MAIAELGDRFVVHAEDGDSAFEVRDEHEAAVEVDVAREANAFGDEAFVLAVEVEHLQAAISTVGNYDLGLAGGALVDPEAMGAVNLADSGTWADDGSNVDAIFGVFVDVTTSIAVANEEVSGWEEGDVGGVPAVAVLVLA